MALIALITPIDLIATECLGLPWMPLIALDGFCSRLMMMIALFEVISPSRHVIGP